MLFRKNSFMLAQNRLFAWVLIVFSVLLLSACSDYVPPTRITKIVTPQVVGPTVSELRRNYIDNLQASGVQVIKLGQTFRFVLMSDELFNPNSANIQSSYRPVLRILAALMNTYDKVSVKVAAYTDNRGVVLRQQALTTRQAQVVASYLWSKGIDARLEYAVGYNRQNAVGWNGNAQGRHFNRRVEVSFQFYPETRRYD